MYREEKHLQPFSIHVKRVLLCTLWKVAAFFSSLYPVFSAELFALVDQVQMYIVQFQWINMYVHFHRLSVGVVRERICWFSQYCQQFTLYKRISIHGKYGDVHSIISLRTHKFKLKKNFFFLLRLFGSHCYSDYFIFVRTPISRRK